MKIHDKFILQFSGEYCGVCRSITPSVKKYVNENDINLYYVDVNEYGHVAKEYDIRGVPTFILIKNGEEVRRFIGGNFEKFKSFVESNY